MAITVPCSAGGEPESLQTSAIASSFRQTLPPRMGRARSWICPKWWSGPIHSVKGGQADVVYLFPDLSQAGDAQHNRGGAARDSVIRVFYVGITRARETLYICQRETGMAMTI